MPNSDVAIGGIERAEETQFEETTIGLYSFWVFEELCGCDRIYAAGKFENRAKEKKG